MRGLRTVLIKECRDNLRDRRTILSSFSLSLLGPALFIGLMSFVLNTTIGESADPAELAVHAVVVRPLVEGLAVLADLVVPR